MMSMGRMFRTLVASAMVLLTACSGGSGGSGGGASSGASTVQAKGTVNSGEIGGTNLTVLSAQQDATSAVSGGAYSTTVSTTGPQLLLIQDDSNALRGLTFSVKADLSPSTALTVLPANATSTALAILLLSPGVTPPDWSFAQPVVAALQTLTSFQAFVTFLQVNLPTKGLADVMADPAYQGLLQDCLAEWSTTAATITPLSSVAASSVAFAVPPKVTPLSANPALETGGIRVDIQNGYTGKDDIHATLTNYSLRSVALYEYSDSTGSGALVRAPNSPEWFQGGDGVTSLSLLGVASKQITPRSISKSVSFTNPNGKVSYYAVGPGFAVYPASLKSEIPVTWEDLAKPVLYDFVKYAVAPVLSFWSGYPVSDLLDAAFLVDGLRKGQDAEIIALLEQIQRISVEEAGAAGSVLAYRTILKNLMQVTLGKVEPFIKGGLRGFFKSVFRVGAIFDSVNFVLYVDDLIKLPARAKIEVSAPYDRVEFTAATFLAKKTDRQVSIGLTRTDGSSDALVVQYTITPVTAVRDQDFSDASPSPGVVRFESGQKTASIPLWILDNPANTGARFATISLGPITGLGKIGPQGALSLTIGSGAPLNVCEADVPTYAPSGCELPRLVARNAYTPIPAGQALPLPELMLISIGTCGVDVVTLHVNSRTGSNWALEIPEPANTLLIGSDHVSMFPVSPSWPSPPYAPDWATVFVHPSSPGSISVPMTYQANVKLGDAPFGFGALIKFGSFNCVFQQETGVSGP
ncbi:MAG: hypothetical protein ABL983_00505 [Nitrospira sp.]